MVDVRRYVSAFQRSGRCSDLSLSSDEVDELQRLFIACWRDARFSSAELREPLVTKKTTRRGKDLLIRQSDGSIWAVPVMVVARDRAANHADEFDGDIEKSLAEDTLPLFESNEYEIKDWAANNMNWSEVEGQASLHAEHPPLSLDDFQEAWLTGDKFID